MDKEISKENEEDKKGNVKKRQVMVDYDEDSDQQESVEEEIKICGKRMKKPCPVPSCEVEVVHLPKHLRNVHKWNKEYARTSLSQFKLRKKYEFSSAETAATGNRKLRKSSGETCTAKKPNRKGRLCPFTGCMTVTKRLPQHLQRKHKLSRADGKYKKYLSIAKVQSGNRPHTFLRIKEARKQSVEDATDESREEERLGSEDQQLSSGSEIHYDDVAGRERERILLLTLLLISKYLT